MNFKRYWYIFRLWTILESSKRTEYMREHSILKEIGKNVSIMDRKVPLYGNLIKIHDNVHIASNVSFVTHDITHCVLNGMKNGGYNCSGEGRFY